jgi:hypothetical protein
MISTTDKEYVETKLIKLGRKRLCEPFDALANWIAVRWGVAVLNLVFDEATALHGPRLQVILEREDDLMSFRQGLNFAQEAQDAIKGQFLVCRRQLDASPIDELSLFVVFSAFAPLARQEADERLGDEQIADLKKRIADPDLWEISRCFGKVTFFFYKDKQVKQRERDGMKAVYSKRYLEILKLHDEFDYVDERIFAVTFDSKENLDKNYGGNWFYYYR